MSDVLRKDWLPILMALTCGQWGWSVERFWQATPFDVQAIAKGMTVLNTRNATAPFSDDDAKMLRALLNSQVMN